MTVQICEERGLVHESRGEGSERFVQVEKNMRSFPRPLLVSLEEPHHKETGTVYMCVWLTYNHYLRKSFNIEKL